MSTTTIVDRIIQNAMQFTMRNIKKEKKEIALLKAQANSDDNNNLDGHEAAPKENGH